MNSAILFLTKFIQIAVQDIADIFLLGIDNIAILLPLPQHSILLIITILEYFHLILFILLGTRILGTIVNTHFQQSLCVVEVELAGGLDAIYNLLDGGDEGLVLFVQFRQIAPWLFG